MKKRNSVKRQIPSIDDKELYEIYMRNHDECKKKIHKQIDACLDEAFPNSSSYKENDLEGDVTFGNFEMGQFEPIDRTEKNRSEQYVDKFISFCMLIFRKIPIVGFYYVLYIKLSSL